MTSRFLQKPNLPAIEAALKEGGNKDYTIKLLPGLNHLFQTSKTGAPSEYSEIAETFSPLALATIGDWIVAHTKSAGRKRIGAPRETRQRDGACRRGRCSNGS